MKNLRVLQGILWVLEGIIVGFGAIMPGISGGTLCVAFGMYMTRDWQLLRSVNAANAGKRSSKR